MSWKNNGTVQYVLSNYFGEENCSIFILFNCLFFSQNGSGCFLQISTHCPLAAYMLKVLQISLLTALGKMLSDLQKGTAYWHGSTR